MPSAVRSRRSVTSTAASSDAGSRKTATADLASTCCSRTRSLPPDGFAMSAGTLRMPSAATALIEGWDAYWFKPASLRRLAACRIAFFALFIVWYGGEWGQALTGYSGTTVYAPIAITALVHEVVGLPNPDLQGQ